MSLEVGNGCGETRFGLAWPFGGAVAGWLALAWLPGGAAEAGVRERGVEQDGERRGRHVPHPRAPHPAARPAAPEGVRLVFLRPQPVGPGGRGAPAVRREGDPRPTAVLNVRSGNVYCQSPPKNPPNTELR